MCDGLGKMDYLLEDLHARIQNWGDLQWEYLFIHNHNSGYEYSPTSSTFLAHACSG